MGISSEETPSIVKWVLTVVSGYAAFVNATGAILVGLAEGVLSLLIEGIIFSVLFIVLGYLSWNRNRWGYLGAGILPLAVISLLQASPVASFQAILQNPDGQTPFALFLPYYVALFVAVPYGLYGFHLSGRPHSVFPQITRTSILAFVAIGIVVGGLLVGFFAASTESRLLGQAGSNADVTIVLGASSSSNAYFFSPANFTAKVGQTVTWVNHNSGPHTVTSNTGVFDSGSISSGAAFSFTFTQAGIYPYHCSYHSWMSGLIVVKGG